MIIDLSVWDQDKTKNNIDEIKRNPQLVTKIILNAVLEYQYNVLYLAGQDTLVELINFAKEHNIELHIITSCHSNYKLIDITNEKYNHVHVHNWPTFWLTLTFSRLTHYPNYQMNFSLGLDVNEVNTGSSLFKYPFITMNKRPKVHRAMMMDMLAKNEIIGKGVVIWREPSQNYQYQYWTEQILLVDQQDEFKSQETVPLEYALSFAQIVTESDEILFILSEKTSMPLYFNKPFLVLGCKNFHKTLQSLGFQLYDELFDYTFDQIESTLERADLIAQNIKRYVDKTPDELKELYLKVFPKIIHNKKTALRLATNSTLIPSIWQELIDHQIENNITDFPHDINNFIKTREDEYRF